MSIIEDEPPVDCSLGKLYEAINIAAYDLLGHAQQQPVSALLGGAKRHAVPLMPTIFPADAHEAADTAARFVAERMRYLKVKLIGRLDHDLSIVRAIREAAPDIKHFVGDANSGYSLTEMLHTNALRELKAAGLTIIEDPCPGEARDFAKLRSENHPRIMIDAQVRSRENLHAVLSTQAADIVNLHPCHQMTFKEAIQRAAICEAQGVTVWIGGTGFLGVGSAAYHHLGSVIGLAGPCGELGGDRDHGMPSLVDSQIEIRNGYAHLTDAPGHGAKPMNRELLAPYIQGSRFVK